MRDEKKTFTGNHRPVDEGSLSPALLQIVQIWKLRAREQRVPGLMFLVTFYIVS